MDNKQLHKFEKENTELRKRNVSKQETELATPVIGSKQNQASYSIDGDDDDDKKESEWEQVEDEKGLFYKQHYLSPAYKFGQQVFFFHLQKVFFPDFLNLLYDDKKGNDPC